MEVITTQTLQLDAHKEEFEISFAWNKKRGVDNDHWFTPTGKCKIYLGALNIQLVGHVSNEVYKTLITMMKKDKTDVLAWGNYNYYTTTNDDSISIIYNINTILYQARKEWDERKYIEFWVTDDRELKTT